VGPRGGPDYTENVTVLTLPGTELRLLDRPACSQSLYRLRYRVSKSTEVMEESEEWRLLGCYAVWLS
jgi:hypothetical protein